MNRSKRIKRIGPCWIDDLVTAVARPWVFILAVAFILTPTKFLIAGLRSGASFLKIGTGARPTAMGGAYTALADDVNALYYNPGGLGRLSQREIGATHTEWLLDTKFDFVGFAQPTKSGTFGLGFTHLSAGAQQGRDANRQTTGDFGASDMAYTMSYSKRMAAGTLIPGGSTSIGGNMKYLQSRIGSYSASTMAMDFGAQHQLGGKPLSLGVSVLNVGQGMKYLAQRDPLPLTMAAGAAYRVAGALQLAMDVRHELPDSRTDVGIGTEYSIFPSFALRAGYGSGMADMSGGGLLGSMNGLGGGFGLKLGNYRADYTFTPFGDLGNAQRISLGARF